MPFATEDIPAIANVTNNTGAPLVLYTTKVAAGATVAINLALNAGKTTDVRRDTYKERTWQAIVEASLPTAARPSPALVINSTTTPSLTIPLTAVNYPAILNGPFTKTTEAYATRPGFPDYADAGQNPYIASVVVGAANAYLDITFNEPVYRGVTYGGVAPLAADFALSVLTAAGAAGTSTAAISSVTKSPSGALTGGETVIRVNLSGTKVSTEKPTITIAAGNLRDGARNKNLVTAITATFT